MTIPLRPGQVFNLNHVTDDRKSVGVSVGIGLGIFVHWTVTGYSFILGYVSVTLLSLLSSLFFLSSLPRTKPYRSCFILVVRETPQ